MDHPDAGSGALTGPLAVGRRLRCPVCRSELIVVTAGDAAVSCCGGPLAPVTPPTR